MSRRSRVGLSISFFFLQNCCWYSSPDCIYARITFYRWLLLVDSKTKVLTSRNWSFSARQTRAEKTGCHISRATEMLDRADEKVKKVNILANRKRSRQSTHSANQTPKLNTCIWRGRRENPIGFRFSSDRKNGESFCLKRELHNQVIQNQS